jgi:hypothetical protein
MTDDQHPEITLDAPAEVLLTLDEEELAPVLARLRRELDARYPDGKRR